MEGLDLKQMSAMVVRLEMGLEDTDPIRNYRSHGYQKAIEAKREKGALTLGGGA